MLCTDKDSQQHQSSFHIQTEICHIGIMPLFVQNQSVITESSFKNATQIQQILNFPKKTTCFKKQWEEIKLL
jgi:hypothetical protein